MKKDKTLEALHNEACQLLEEVGIKCENEEIRKIYEDTGLAAYDETTGRIHILRDLIDQSLSTTPKRSVFTSLVPEHSFCSGGTAPYIYDEKTSEWIEPDLYEHVAKIVQIAEKYKVPAMFRGAGKQHDEYEDVEQIKVYNENGYSGLRYIYVATEAGVQACKKEYAKNNKLVTSHSVFYSPLALNDSGPNVPIFLRCIEEDLPIYLVTMPVSKINAPASIYGLVLITHAEFLAGMCLVQILNPGLITLHAGYPLVSSVTDDYNIDFGSIQHNFANLTMARVAKSLDLPSIQSGCTTSNKHPEADTEKDVLDAYRLWNSSDDWHQVRHCFGFLEYQMAFSIPKMERDCKSLQKIIENNEKIEVPELEYDSEAYNVIVECAPIGTFVEHAHTLKYIGYFYKNEVNR